MNHAEAVGKVLGAGAVEIRSRNINFGMKDIGEGMCKCVKTPRRNSRARVKRKGMCGLLWSTLCLTSFK